MTSLPAIEQIEALIRPLAQSELLPRFALVNREHKHDGSIVTEADLTMQAKMIDALQQRWPEIPLLGEEMSAEQQQQLLDESALLWCLDPLDGTSNFAAGLPYFCVSLALLSHGEPQLGVIYDPIRDEMFSAIKAEGARLNGEPIHCSEEVVAIDKSIAFIDLKRLSSELAAYLAAEQPFSSQRNFGSGALDWAWLAAGRYQLYLHGGQKLWDYSVGSLILAESGGVAKTLAGEAIINRTLTPRSVVAAPNSTMYQAWQETIAKVPQ